MKNKLAYAGPEVSVQKVKVQNGSSYNNTEEKLPLKGFSWLIFRGYVSLILLVSPF